VYQYQTLNQNLCSFFGILYQFTLGKPKHMVNELTQKQII